MRETITFCIFSHSLIITLMANQTIGWNSENAKTCTPERTLASNGEFVWKIKQSHIDYVISEPDVCWQNNSIVVRQCDTSGSKSWKPEIQSCEKVKRRNLKCPEDLSEKFVHGKAICLKISEKRQHFNDNYCYGSNYILNSNDDALMKFLLTRNIDGLWLPVKRIEEKRFKPHVIRLPGASWNKLYDISFDNQITISNKHCVGAYLSKDEDKPKIKIEPTDCNDTLYSVCIYKDELVAKSGCPQNFGALSYRPNECYGMTWEGQKYPQDMRMLNVVEYYEKYNILRAIFDDHKINMDGYAEVKGTSQIPNGKWTINIKKDILSISPSGNRTKSLCIEHVPNRKNVEMVLRMDSNHETLLLTVYNKFYIWSFKNKNDFSIHCFANTNYGELIKVKLHQIWENELKTKTMFELDIKNDNPCYYWCEAHTIFNFTSVSSTKIVAAKRKKGHNFAMQFDIALERKDTKLAAEPLRKIIKRLTKDIEKKMKNQQAIDKQLEDLLIHSVRIMDIVYVSLDASQLRCLCHATVSLKSYVVDYSSEATTDDYSVESEEYTRRDTEAQMRVRNLLVHLIQELQPHMIGTVRSTEYCFPENNWPLVAIGQVATVSIFCLQDNGLPLTRKCLGNFLEGAYWETVSSSQSMCITNVEHHLITKDLFEMDLMKIPKKEPETAVKNIRKLLEYNLTVLIPADLYYLAKIIRKSIKNIFRVRGTSPNIAQLNVSIISESILPQTHISSDIVLDIERIYNYLMNVSGKVMHSSHVLNSTNILLDTFEYLMDEISVSVLEPDVWPVHIGSDNSSDTKNKIKSTSDQEIDVKYHNNAGVVVKIATNFVIFAINPSVANVTGVALFQADLESDEYVDDENMLRGAFENEYYRFVLANQSVNDLLNENRIVLGTFVPSSLWQRLDEISSLSSKNKTVKTKPTEPSVVIKIYSNDKLFQESKEAMTGSVVGKVISVSIPGHDKDLPEVLPLILTNSDSNQEDHKQYCSYWNYETWAKDGVTLLDRSNKNNNTVLCACTHLTPFAYLVRGSYDLSVDSDIEVVVTKVHENALNIITFLGCSLSLFGVVGIFATACIFRSWRQKANSKVLLQLSAAIALQMILFCFVNTKEYSHHLIANEIFPSCIAIGAFLHYSVLVQFCWMFIIAYLQFKRYVQVFGNTRPKRFFVKSALVGWGLPVIPVALVLTFDSASYIPHTNDSNNPICYPSGKSLYISIVLPIALVIMANLVIFVVVIFNILKSPSGSIRRTEKSLALSQIRLLLLLFFLLGFTWIFGLMTAMDAGLVFSYLFCLTATLQGFILFIYFILLDPITRRMWCGNLRRWFDFNDNSDSSCSMKDTTQSL